jgi:hypothetical protein
VQLLEISTPSTPRFTEAPNGAEKKEILLAALSGLGVLGALGGKK